MKSAVGSWWFSLGPWVDNPSDTRKRAAGRWRVLPCCEPRKHLCVPLQEASGAAFCVFFVFFDFWCWVGVLGTLGSLQIHHTNPSDEKSAGLYNTQIISQVFFTWHTSLETKWDLFWRQADPLCPLMFPLVSIDFHCSFWKKQKATTSPTSSRCSKEFPLVRPPTRRTEDNGGGIWNGFGVEIRYEIIAFLIAKDVSTQGSCVCAGPFSIHFHGCLLNTFMKLCFFDQRQNLKEFELAACNRRSGHWKQRIFFMAAAARNGLIYLTYLAEPAQESPASSS